MNKTTTQTSLRILSRTENLQAVRKFITAHARTSGFDEETVQNIVLAVDEACTNIIRHAYNGNPDGVIDIHVQNVGNALEVQIFDTGKKFDPSRIQPPDVQKNVHRQERGGFGLYLMKRLMDEVEFHFAPGAPNTLRMRKYLSARS